MVRTGRNAQRTRRRPPGRSSGPTPLDEVAEAMEEQSIQHLGEKENQRIWDWWKENPGEIIVVALILVLFVVVPWQGCGVSEAPEVRPSGEFTVVP